MDDEFAELRDDIARCEQQGQIWGTFAVANVGRLLKERDVARRMLEAMNTLYERETARARNGNDRFADVRIDVRYAEKHGIEMHAFRVTEIRTLLDAADGRALEEAQGKPNDQ
jgi:hypothetical protein